MEHNPQAVLIGKRLDRRYVQLSMHPRQEQIFAAIPQKRVDQRLAEAGLEIKIVVFRESPRISHAYKVQGLKVWSESRGIRRRAEKCDEGNRDRHGSIAALGAVYQHARVASLHVMREEYEPDGHPSFKLVPVPLPLLDRELQVMPISRPGTTLDGPSHVRILVLGDVKHGVERLPASRGPAGSPTADP